MVVSEKTGINFAIPGCDKFASLLMAYRGIEEVEPQVIEQQQQRIEKDFLRMSFAFLKNASGRLLFIVTIGKRGKGKEVDRLNPANAQEAVAFANLLAQINAEQRQGCRNCNPHFKQCIISETLKLYKKRIIAQTPTSV